jgi:hypothetical protein
MCNASECIVPVLVTACLNTAAPPFLKLDFAMLDPFTSKPQSISVIGRDDIRWEQHNLKPTTLGNENTIRIEDTASSRTAGDGSKTLEDRTSWLAVLQEHLRRKVLSKLHKHNKYVAVWQTRRLVRAWARGSVSMGIVPGEMGFLGEEAVVVALSGLGILT